MAPRKQGVSRWIELGELAERRFSNETGEFLLELALSNTTTIFECDIQLNPSVLGQYKRMLRSGCPQLSSASSQQHVGPSPAGHSATDGSSARQQQQVKSSKHSQQQARKQLINLDTNCFTFGAFDWSLTIVPLVLGGGGGGGETSNSSKSPPMQNGAHQSEASGESGQTPLEPVCRIYLNRLSGFDSLCRVKYRVILGHHQQSQSASQPIGQSSEFVDSKALDQVSDCAGRIRGYQFRHTNILRLISLRHTSASASTSSSAATSASASASPSPGRHHHHHQNNNHHHHHHNGGQQQQQLQASSVDLRVHIEMFCANTISEARVKLERRPNEPQVSNCSDRNKQAWCIESDCESGDTLKLKLFFLDLHSVPRNHIRHISWIAYLVRRDPKSGSARDSLAVRNSPHSNYYLQDGMDLGTIMDTNLQVKEVSACQVSTLSACRFRFSAPTLEWLHNSLRPPPPPPPPRQKAEPAERRSARALTWSQLQLGRI